MAVTRERIERCLSECTHHLTEELLPFWLDRCRDEQYGGFLTHFDEDGNLAASLIVYRSLGWRIVGNLGIDVRNSKSIN